MPGAAGLDCQQGPAPCSAHLLPFCSGFCLQAAQQGTRSMQEPTLGVQHTYTRSTRVTGLLTSRANVLSQLKHIVAILQAQKGHGG